MVVYTRVSLIRPQIPDNFQTLIQACRFIPGYFINDFQTCAKSAHVCFRHARNSRAGTSMYLGVEFSRGTADSVPPAAI